MSVGSFFIDASVLVTVAVICVAATLCVRALFAARLGARTSRQYIVERRGRDRARSYKAVVVLWTLLAGLLALFALGGPLDLFERVTDIGRGLALSQGWYGERRPLQTIVLAILLTAGAGLFLVLLRQTRRHLPRQVPAVVGLVAIASLLGVDLLSLHGVDAMLRQSFLAVSVRELLLLVAIVPVVGCAVLSSRWTQDASLVSSPAGTDPTPRQWR